MASAGISRLLVEPDGQGLRATLSGDGDDGDTVSLYGERVKRIRTKSPAAINRNIEDSELCPVDSSTSIPGRSHGNEILIPVAANSTNSGIPNIDQSLENRFANIEKMLSTQQELLQKLVAAQEPSPSPIPTPSEVYERAREEAEFVDFHHWDSLYIHGLVRINGKVSHSVTQNPLCEPCTAYNRVCIVLSEDDPYREFLFVERNVCCGWCEYATIPSSDYSRNREAPERGCEEDGNSSSRVECEKGEKDRRPKEGVARRMSNFFVSGKGLDEEVMHSEITRYLGNDAVIQPGTYTDPKSSNRISGYYITAYRAPTCAMLEDLRAESVSWQALKPKEAQNSSLTGSRRPQYAYGPINQNYGYGSSHHLSAINQDSAPTGSRQSPRLLQLDRDEIDPNVIDEWIYTVGSIPISDRISLSP